MSHGLSVTHIGTCPVCLRENMDLHEHLRPGRVPGLSCVDQFSCFATWLTLR